MQESAMIEDFWWVLQLPLLQLLSSGWVRYHDLWLV